MEVIQKRIFARNYEEKVFTIVPIGDIHFGSLSFDERSWNSFLKAIEKITNPLFIFVGDITDDDRPSTRDKRRSMFLDRVEAWKQEDEEVFNRILKKVLPRLSFVNSENCLGMLDGDHYRVFSNGKTSTELICKALGVPYLGLGQAIIKLIFSFRKSLSTKSHLSFTIHARHGRGYSSTIGGKLNSNRKFIESWEGVDLFVKGHSHSSWDDVVVRNRVTERGTICDRKIFAINAGSFKKTFIMKDEIDNESKKVLNLMNKSLDKLEKDELKRFIGIKAYDVDYAELREYPPTNKMIIGLKLIPSQIEEKKENSKVSYHYFRKEIISIDL